MSATLASDMTRITALEIAHCFDTHSAGMVLYARQFVTNETAEDLVQETFIKLAAQSDKPQNIHAWLMRTVRNAAIDAQRTSKHRRAREQSTQPRPWFTQNLTAPIEAAELQSALAQLPTDHREVIILRIWNAATFEQIAELTATPMSTVYTRYREALSTLRQHWEIPCKND
jgi:RNA polymerase sigma-70 factor (ECF subfamily)